METEITNLSQLPLNREGIIQELKCEGNIRRRLLDLEEQEGKKKKKAPSNPEEPDGRE